MRKKSLLLAAIAAVLVSACSKDDNTDGSGSGKAASVQITVLGTDAASTKATGDLPSSTEENVVKSVTVGLFTKDGTTDAISEGTLTDGKITVTGTEGERQVVVVANAKTKTFAGVLTKADFLAKVVELTQTKDNLPMSGQGAALVELKAGAANTPKIAVKISRLVARIQLESLKTAFDPAGQYANATFKADRIFLYNVKSKSSVDATSTTELVHGYIGKNADGTDISGNVTSLLDTFTGTEIGATAYETPYYFYTFANDDTKETATKIVIGGYFKKNSSATPVYVYYPAVINRVQTGTEFTGNTDNHAGIMRNNIYSVKATIKNIGVKSPDMFMEPADLDLGVTVADWALKITQEIEF